MATEGRRLNNQARLASLQAELSFLDKCERIASEELRMKSEELRLKQMKEKLKLETQMAKISAEEKVFTEFETRSQTTTEDKPFSVSHVSTSTPP